jgi:hypothetical protein
MSIALDLNQDAPTGSATINHMKEMVETIRCIRQSTPTVPPRRQIPIL